MTKDYKKVSESSKSSKGSKSQSKSANNTLPPWLWLLAGLVIGGFVSFLVFLKIKVPETAPVVVEEKAKPTIKTPPQEIVVTPPPEKEDRFEFYSILPKREVTVPPTEQSKPVVNDATTEKTNVVGSGNEAFQYELQAGSFVRFQDADRRKANLALIGIMSKIYAVESEDKTLYRVRIGPYGNVAQANEIEAILKENKIPSLLIKVKG